MIESEEIFHEVIDDNVNYVRDSISKELSRQYFDALRDTVEWSQKYLTFNTSKIPFPRLVAWYGDEGANYYYSGIHNSPLSWTPLLHGLRCACNMRGPPHKFNSVLLNYYRSGEDSIGYHSDDERDLVKDSTIATVSFGGPRTLCFKSKENKKDVRKIILEPGSLLTMGGDCQKNWLHSIPKEIEMKEPRISLTFRTVKIKK